MKGLLLKDFYVTLKTARMDLFIIVLFLFLSVVNSETLFYLSYPCLIAGMLPVKLLSYDERNRWFSYSGTLPYSPAQIVSAKYVIGLVAQLAVASLCVGMRVVIGLMHGDLNIMNILLTMGLAILINNTMSVVCLPFMYRFGVEKGRPVYYVVLIAVAVALVLIHKFSDFNLSAQVAPGFAAAIFMGIALLIYGLSWWLSIVFYKKREV